MTILFGHPGGNPNSHQAALAHFEAGVLEAFCVPWLPRRETVHRLSRIPGLGASAARFVRRSFPPLEPAPVIQGRLGEMRRLALRAIGRGDERLSYEANDWLMRVMSREAKRPRVTAVHSYEDCALWQFRTARQLGKACIYDMPIGFYGAWQETEKLLFDQFPDWAPSDDRVTSQYVRPDQKSEEMELADLVLVPSSFVRKTIEIKYRAKQIELAAYGVDTDFWRPVERKDSASRHMKFIYAGQISLRKGIPLLLEAWRSADIPDATLQLVGLWKLSNAKRTNLPPNVVLIEPRSPTELRRLYQESDVFVFPSYFEGFGLVLLEAMACGLPAIATNATAGPDVLSADCGIVVPMADWEALAAALMRMAGDRDRLEEMRAAARARALTHSWDRYRGQVARATARFTS